MDGCGECEHDTPSALHGALWGRYHARRDHIDIRERVIIKAGPFKESLPYGRTKAWVIIDLDPKPGRTSQDAIDAANALVKELTSLHTTQSPVTASFRVLAMATEP